MADLAFLLLIFFMAATNTETPKSVEVELPVGKTQGAEQESIFVSITRDEQLYYEGEKISPDALKSKLGFQTNKEKVIALTGDRNVSYRKISQIINMLKDEGFLKVVFLAQEREK